MIQRNINSVSFKTLGCKLNQSETDAISAKFKEKGFEIRPFGEESDLTILNTCTVTNDADSKSRSTIRKAIKTSPKGRIVVTGCYAQVNPEEIEKISGVDLILGSDEKYHIFDYLDRLNQGKNEEPLTFVNEQGDFDSVSADGFVSATSRTRAFLKIQEGCDYYCSYCIIPFARGKARSRNFNETLDECKKLASQGYHELVLTGINIGTYEDEEHSFVELLQSMEKIDGLKRIRISSIEPNTVSDELMQLVADSDVLCPHFHIPLQAGHNDILKAMNRKYILDDYSQLMARFKRILPHAALGTDIIVGFPGETDEHFQSTLNFVENNPFSYLHIFRYSARTGTVASKLVNPVDFHIAKKRSSILHELAKKKKHEFAEKFIGTREPVLFDQWKDNVLSGYTNHYIRVDVQGHQNQLNTIENVKLTSYSKGQFKGNIVT
jgi:threonylcarbamoyladenosine tRNA methylthiotransferase MtaB